MAGIRVERGQVSPILCVEVANQPWLLRIPPSRCRRSNVPIKDLIGRISDLMVTFALTRFKLGIFIISNT